MLALWTKFWKLCLVPASLYGVVRSSRSKWGLLKISKLLLETLVAIRLVAALRHLSFAKGYDTNFAADLTIMEKGNKLINRIKKWQGSPYVYYLLPDLNALSETKLFQSEKISIILQKPLTDGQSYFQDLWG